MLSHDEECEVMSLGAVGVGVIDEVMGDASTAREAF